MASIATKAATLGQVLKKARADVGLSQRAIEQATGKAVSNAYLSQLESGKVTNPSPHVLKVLSQALSISYETLMERAGYASPSQQAPANSRVRASYAVTNLTADEESQLLDYLSYIRSRNRHPQ